MGSSQTFQSLPCPKEWFQSCKGHRVALRRWPATGGVIKGTVVLQHGGGWHSGYFGGLAASLNDAGYHVAALDATGHGFSEGPGPKTYWDSLQSVRADLLRFCRQEKARSPELPLVLYAESMGVLLAVPVATDNDANISGLILAGGLFKLHPKTAPPRVVLFILKLLAWIWPTLTIRLPSLEATFDDAFGDPRWAAAARSDSNIVVDQFAVGPAVENLGAIKDMPSYAEKVACPLLVMHAATDLRTDARAAQSFFDAAASSSKKVIIYADGAHQLFQDSEANVARHTSDLIGWLNQLWR